MSSTSTPSTVVVDTTRSPFAALLPLSLDTVRLDGFLGNWQRVNRENSIPYAYEKLHEAGVFANFTAAAQRRQAEFQGAMFFSDTDLYKWLEAACFELANNPDDALRKQVDDAVRLVGDAQMEDGYVNTHFQLTNIEDRWTDLSKHEMYCAGHLIQAAIAHHRTTGSEDFLDIACRVADHIDSVFGPGKRPGCPGHPEIEMALVELYRVTGEKRYVDLSRFLLGNRGKGYVNGKVMYGDHRDAIGIKQPEGHAVMQVYLLCGITDAYTETGEQVLLDTIVDTWESMSQRRMAITGGVGVRPRGEAFGADYELPNESTYNETCAQIASVMWCWRMLLLTGEARYADLMERTIYNGVLPGVDLDGKAFFYGNGLLSRSGGKRNPWDFNCACCPPNVLRTLASINGYVATTTTTGLQIHLYDAGRITASIGGKSAGTRADGDAATTVDATLREVAVRVDTDYPWDSKITLTIENPDAGEWDLSLRIPEWCESATLKVNGESITSRGDRGSATGAAVIPGGEYAVVRREWRAGDTVELDLPMVPVYYEAHPHIDTARAAVALGRGPLIYCIEGHDQPDDVALLDCTVNPKAGEPEAEWRPGELGGVMILKAAGVARDRSSWDGKLYRPIGDASDGGRDVVLTAIPYYAWANREPSPMRVWIPTGRRADG